MSAEAQPIATTAMRVLVADEQAATRKNVSELLASERDTEVVGAARDGDEALKMALALRPDVLVLDLGIAAMDGINVLLRLRRERPEIRIVVYTSESASCQLALRAGARACVTKDGPPQKLIDAVRGDRLSVHDLRAAIDGHELQIALQPLVDARSGEVGSLEVLCRWPHQSRGQIAPLRFIGAAEETGLITALTVEVARAAAREIARLANSGHSLIANLNVSLGALLDPSFHDALLRAAADAACAPASLGVEITESTLMTDPVAVARALARLRELGMRIAIDDFGTGYSSFARLIDLPLDALKIDRRFVASMTDDQRSASIVKACIDIAHNFGIEAIAEGVETPETMAMLRALDCDVVQGDLLAMPMSPGELSQWLSSQSPRPSHVLVVDDEPAIVATLRDILQAEGFRVATASNGLEAIHAVQKTAPAVVLLDMQMPHADGPAFAQMLRARGLTVPIIVMTAGSSAQRWAQTIRADGFLSKPFDLDSVVAVTSRFARKQLTH